MSEIGNPESTRSAAAIRQDIAEYVLSHEDEMSEVPGVKEFVQEHGRLTNEIAEGEERAERLAKAKEEYEPLEQRVSSCRNALKDAEAELAKLHRPLGTAAFEAFIAGDLEDQPAFADRLIAHKRVQELQQEHDDLAPAADAGLTQKAKAKAQQLAVTGKIKLEEMKCSGLETEIGRQVVNGELDDSVRCDSTSEHLRKIAERRESLSGCSSELQEADAAREKTARQLCEAVPLQHIENSKTFDTEMKKCKKTIRESELARSNSARSLADDLKELKASVLPEALNSQLQLSEASQHDISERIQDAGNQIRGQGHLVVSLAKRCWRGLGKRGLIALGVAVSVLCAVVLLNRGNGPGALSTGGSSSSVMYSSWSLVKEIQIPTDTSQSTISPDGQLVAVTGNDNGLLLYKTDTAQLASWKGSDLPGDSSATFARFSPDGKLLAWQNNNDVVVWDTQDDRLIVTLPGYAETSGLRVRYRTQMLFSQDGTILATACDGDYPPSDLQVVRLWDTSTWKKVGELPGTWPISLSANNDLLAAIDSETGEKIVVRSISNKQPLFEVTSVAKDVQRTIGTLAFAPNDPLLAFSQKVSSRCRSVCIYDVTKKRRISSFKWGVGHVSSVGSLAFSPDGRTLAIAGSLSMRTDAVHLRDVATGRIVSFAGDTYVTSLSFSGDGTHFATSGGSAAVGRVVRVWGREEGNEGDFIFTDEDEVFAPALKDEQERLAREKNRWPSEFKLGSMDLTETLEAIGPPDSKYDHIDSSKATFAMVWKQPKGSYTVITGINHITGVHLQLRRVNMTQQVAEMIVEDMTGRKMER
jgi:WD40 repeat protein